MKKNNWKKREGVVYSTNPEFEYQQGEQPDDTTPAPAKQQLRVSLDTSMRAGKQVTLVTGFVGSEGDRDALCKQLKSRCGVGGSVKDGAILIQGDMRKKVGEELVKSGYRVRVI